MMSLSYGRLLCVGVVVGLLGMVAAFPGRGASAAALWCPKAALRDGRLEPVLRRIVEDGPRAWGDSGVPDNTPPPWLDRRRLEAGRAFVLKYPASIVFGHVHSLYLLLAVQPVLDVLVYTGNSNTPDIAFLRYLDTVKGVGAWYTSDIFTPGTFGHEELKRVRSLHNLVRMDMAERPQEDVRNRTRLGGVFSGCPISAAVRRDLGRRVNDACPGEDTDGIGEKHGGPPRGVWMSQYDMSLTQWAFIGPVLQFPEQYGIGNATREELDGFVHLWEVFGYALGIDDRFNFCQGGLEATLRRARETLSTIVLPGLRGAQPPWEYMTRCMADGLGYLLPGIGFESQLATLLVVTLDSPTPALEALLGRAQREAVAGYRGIMRDLRQDRDGALWWPFRAYFKQFFAVLRSVNEEDVKRIRHRPPHRSRGCSPELQP